MRRTGIDSPAHRTAIRQFLETDTRKDKREPHPEDPGHHGRRPDRCGSRRIGSGPGADPGDRAFFPPRLASPPAEGRNIDIRLFNRRDIAGGSV